MTLGCWIVLRRCIGRRNVESGLDVFVGKLGIHEEWVGRKVVGGDRQQASKLRAQAVSKQHCKRGRDSY
jgi:hypothetical protein